MALKDAPDDFLEPRLSTPGSTEPGEGSDQGEEIGTGNIWDFLTNIGNYLTNIKNYIVDGFTDFFNKLTSLSSKVDKMEKTITELQNIVDFLTGDKTE